MQVRTAELEHLGIGVTGGCKPPNLAAESVAENLWKSMFLTTELTLKPEYGQSLVLTCNATHQMHAIIVYKDSKKALKKDEL